MADVPQVRINLDDYRRDYPNHTEWFYGEEQYQASLWPAAYPVVAHAGHTVHGVAYPTAVDFLSLSITRDEIPKLIAWLTAVYVSTDPAALGTDIEDDDDFGGDAA